MSLSVGWRKVWLDMEGSRLFKCEWNRIIPFGTACTLTFGLCSVVSWVEVLEGEGLEDHSVPLAGIFKVLLTGTAVSLPTLKTKRHPEELLYEHMSVCRSTRARERRFIAQRRRRLQNWIITLFFGCKWTSMLVVFRPWGAPRPVGLLIPWSSG